MTNAETIQPALTAEEWVNVCVQGECRADDVWSMTRRWHPDPDDRPLGIDEPEPNYHAIAALCLHEQSFGFTREDVDDERVAAFDAEQRAATADKADRPFLLARAKRHEARADRIAALLPPE